MMTIVSLIAAALSMRFAGHLSNTPEMRRVTASIDDIARMPRQQCVSLAQSPEVRTCDFGDPSAGTRIVLFGDSHAIQWFNPLMGMAESHGWKLTTFVKSGCPATDLREVNSPAFATACNTWRAEAIRRLVGIRPSAVFIGNATAYLRGENNKPSISLQDWRDGTRRTLESLSNAGLRVAVMRDNPHFAFDVPTCWARSLRHSWYPGGSCETSQSAALDPAIFAAEKAAAQGLSNVHFIDMTDQLCREDTCWTLQKGEVMYRDDNHLTGSFADRLMPVLESRFLPVLKF
jgi:hypothetical protein